MKYQHRVLGMLALLSVITYLDRVCIAVAGPRMQDALHISPEAWGWVTSVFFLSYSVFEIPTGALGDRIGPRRVLTRVVAWWSAFTSLTGAGFELLPVAVGPVLFRSRRGGRLSQCLRGHWTLDPDYQAHARLGRYMDDQPGRCRLIAASGGADPIALGMACAVLRIRPRWIGLERGLVRVVSGFAT